MMSPFVFLAYTSLEASRTVLQWLLACIYFALDSEDLFCWYKQKEWYQWTNQLKAVEMSKGWTDICLNMFEYVWIYDNRHGSKYVSYNK